MDRYRCFAELAAAQTEGEDFAVRLRPGRSGYCIAAPHGGWIERGTEYLADAVAGREHAFYAFSGLKRRSAHLHITSDNFDEPRALALLAGVDTVVTFHGARGRERCTWFGGLDMALRASLQTALREAGFRADDDASHTRQGRGRSNICNRGRRGRGVQVELPVGMRKALFDYIAPQRCWRINAAGERFIAVFREVLA